MSPKKPIYHSQRSTILFRLRVAVSLVILIVLIGTFGFMLLLDLDAFQAFYFTVATMTTVGYGDIVPQTDFARVMTAFFILGGFGVAYYSLTLILALVLEGELQGMLGARTLQKKIDNLRHHTIVCGYGRIGEDLAQSFTAEGVPFVVVDVAGPNLQRGLEAGHMMIEGDATQDETLVRAGIAHARAIVPALASDVDNLFIVISARQLNPALNIVARAQDESTATKMKKAGADKIVRPLHIGAQHLAQACLRPTVLDFVRISGHAGDQEYSIEEIVVHEQSELAAKSVVDSNIRSELGVILLGIKRLAGVMVFNPDGQTQIHAGDTLVAVGDGERLARLKHLARKKESQ